MKKESPKVSVITVVYNAKESIRETIESVISQTYDNVEYIIIDGGSADGTLEIIDEYKEHISYILSESDEGIYDAMNKGIIVASGAWLNFLNAGDLYADEKVLNKIFIESKYGNEINLIYGSIVVRDANKTNIVEVNPKKFTKFNMIFWGTGTLCHQAMFVSSDIISSYSTHYQLKGELNWYFDLLKNIDNYLIVDFPVVFYTLGGTGDVNFKLNNLETIVVMFRRNGIFGILSIPFILYGLLKKLMEKGK